MKDKFDYQYLAICQYDDGCGLPAVAKGWWVTENGQSSREIYLCLKHLELIIDTENDKP